MVSAPLGIKNHEKESHRAKLGNCIAAGKHSACARLMQLCDKKPLFHD